MLTPLEEVMTNLDSKLKSRDITLPTKVRLVKAMVFLVAMYGCESWTIKKAESEVTQSCLTLCNPMDCSLPRSSVHGIFQARVLEWVAISFSRGSSQPRDWTWVSCTAGRRFTTWATMEAPKKAEHWRIDAFELWCWRRLLRVPWTARRSSKSILKEISPGCSLEELMLKLKLQYFGHLMRRSGWFEKILMLGKIEGRRRRGWRRMRWLDGITNSMDMSLGRLQDLVIDREAWRPVIHGIDMTEWLNWTELKWLSTHTYFIWIPLLEPFLQLPHYIHHHHHHLHSKFDLFFWWKFAATFRTRSLSRRT